MATIQQQRETMKPSGRMAKQGTTASKVLHVVVYRKGERDDVGNMPEKIGYALRKVSAVLTRTMVFSEWTDKENGYRWEDHYDVTIPSGMVYRDVVTFLTSRGIRKERITYSDRLGREIRPSGQGDDSTMQAKRRAIIRDKVKVSVKVQPKMAMSFGVIQQRVNLDIDIDDYPIPGHLHDSFPDEWCSLDEDRMAIWETLVSETPLWYVLYHGVLDNLKNALWTHEMSKSADTLAYLDNARSKMNILDKEVSFRNGGRFPGIVEIVETNLAIAAAQEEERKAKSVQGKEQSAEMADLLRRVAIFEEERAAQGR